MGLRDYHRTIIKSTGRNEIEVGDVVVVENRDVPRQRWKLGVVTDTFTGKDGYTRSAAVKLGSSRNIINRPVNKLYPLEVCARQGIPNDKIDAYFDKDMLNANVIERNGRSRREAVAVLGELKRIYGNIDVDQEVDGGGGGGDVDGGSMLNK